MKKFSPSFTLIELMAASTVMSIVLLLLLGIQDQMSRAWSNANKKTSATREARAALRLMAADLGAIYFKTNMSTIGYAYNPMSNTVPLVVFADGAVTTAGISIPNAQAQPSGASKAIFALVRRPSVGTNGSFDEIAAVGYYVGSNTTTDINGFRTTSYNLYRFYRPASNLVSNLIVFNGTNVSSLFTPSLSDEILARNACNLQLTFYGPTAGTMNGLITVVPEGPTGTSSFYSGNKLQIELTVYPDEVVSSGVLGTTLMNWGLSKYVQKYGRTFEIRQDILRSY
jgi:type II secretory pathway pseudopilin PulG